jgi:hypothetical protein
MRLIPLTAFLICSFIALSCSSAGSDNSVSNSSVNNADVANSASAPRDSVDDLSMMINLPIEPEEATWKDPQPGENKLTAVLLFSNEDAAKFSSHLAAQGQPKPDTISIEDWFPPEVRSQGDLGGEMTLKGDAYPAGDLLQPPYTEGKVSRVANSNFFVVQLTAK